MGSTNKTPNFKLPLFADNDKPSWRGDINDFSNKVETALNDVTQVSGTASNLASTAMSLATTAKEASDLAIETANAATDTANAATDTANDATTAAAVANATANSAKETANAAKAESSSAVSKANEASNASNSAVAAANAANSRVDDLEEMVIGGDTGWINITSYYEGVTPNSNEPPQVRVLNGVVYYRGVVNVESMKQGWNRIIKDIPAVARSNYSHAITVVATGPTSATYNGGVYPEGSGMSIEVLTWDVTPGEHRVRIGGSAPL